MNQKKIGKFIQERRKLKELTQVELADKLGVSNRTISSWENGNSLPDYSMFQDLCNELDISINELLSGEKLTEENYQQKLEENFVSTIDYNNKKRNKKIKKFIIFIIILVVLYLLYKVFIAYFYYKDYSNHEDNSFPYNQNIETIQIQNNNKANTKVLHDELNIYIPEGFELITDKAKSNFVMDNCEPYIKGLIDNNNFDAMILVCNTRRAIDIGNIDYHGINSTIFPWMNVYRLFEKYDIHDSIDLIKFYEKHYQFKQNLFTNSNDIKINYIARNYSNFTIPSYDTFYYLENDLRGYTIEYKRNKDKYFQQTVLSYKDGMYSENNYGVSFCNNKEEYFNHENSMEIVSSISR
ncbi:MAG: helix-turn-helix transcriptional regulator [Bacilli bacterium]|nr:helix-turn-helix transcriptional regulator [Bacilli bacterium]